MVGVPGALSAAWLRLRALDGLLCRDFSDRLFQYTISFFARLRLKCTSCTALSALDVVPERLCSALIAASYLPAAKLGQADAIDGTRPQNRWSGCRGHSQLSGRKTAPSPVGAKAEGVLFGED